MNSRSLAVIVLALTLVTSSFGQNTAARIASGGIADRQNSYAWCLGDFNGDLYVGTGRYIDTFNVMWEGLWLAMDPGATTPDTPSDMPQAPFLQEFLTNTPLGVVVKDPLALAAWNAVARAEIWRYRAGAWTRVYQARMVPSYLLDTNGARPYLTSEATGFRSMTTYRDRFGRTALYAFSGGYNFALPGTAFLIYRSLEGTNWTGIRTQVGMGPESRASAVHNSKLYVGAGKSVVSTPSVWCTDDPTNTATWRKVFDLGPIDTNNTAVISLCSFNNRLYAGTENRRGFQVWASKVADPTGNVHWVRVVTDGAGDRYNSWAGTMKDFKGYLYVGSMSFPYLNGYEDLKGFDLIRIAANNSWQLIVGDMFPVDSPGGFPFRFAASGYGSGFNNVMNWYCWSLEVYNGTLYLGSFDASVFLRYLDTLSGGSGPLDQMVFILENLPTALLLTMNDAVPGADLWKSTDGVRWSSFTQSGFGNEENYGMRTLKSTASRMYVGTANPFEGCEVWTIPPQPIIVTVPNGGESWGVGALQTIRWMKNGIGGNVKIEISRDGGATWQTLKSSTSNSGNWNWTVTGPASANCRIRVKSTSNASANDQSDFVFTVR
ncbi:MAG: hypothetical protein V1873_07340 [Verrucomicrobiota bacterium]